MTPDELAIRNLVASWMKASQAGDLETVLGPMTDDVVFMVPGGEPASLKPPERSQISFDLGL